MLLMRLTVLVFVAPLAACDPAAEAPANAASAPPRAVTVLTLRPNEVTPGFSFNGRVVAVDEVQLRARFELTSMREYP
jgi:hypothetical protein